jgi:hypothetical protein
MAARQSFWTFDNLLVLRDHPVDLFLVRVVVVERCLYGRRTEPRVSVRNHPGFTTLLRLREYRGYIEIAPQR